MVTALRGTVAVLTRFSDESDAAWDAVRTTPVLLPAGGAVVGLLAGITLLVPAPLATPPALYLGTLYLLTGTGHLAGLASLAGTGSGERDAGLVAVVLVVVALALGALSLVGTGGGGLGGLAGASITLSLVVASEVSATAGVATLLARGAGTADGRADADATALLPVAVVLLLCVAVTPAVARPAVVAALGAGVVVALAVGERTRGREATVSGTADSDALGAATELGRVVAVHVGVVVWTVV
jgi:adenosylcobinamide-GDP ribazoletransferase